MLRPSAFLLVLAAFCSLSTFIMTVTAGDRAKPSTGADRPYEILELQNRGGGGIKAVNVKNENTVFRVGKNRRHNWEVVEWALANARITLIRQEIHVDHTINVPVSDTTLIVGPDGRLMGPKAQPNKQHSGVASLPPVIRNARDDFRVFNLGAISARGELVPESHLSAVFFDGRNGGKNGIRGGLIFSTGATGKFNAPYWVVDSAGVKIPLLWSKDYGDAVLAIEGTDDLHAGFVAGLLPSDTEAEAQVETMDLNSFSRNTRLDHVLGTFVKGQDEILDINNSPRTMVGTVTGVGQLDASADELIERDGNDDLVSFIKYGRDSRRITQKPYIGNNSSGSKVKQSNIINKNVKQWNTTVETPGFPGTLPTLKIHVHLEAEFMDGSTLEVFENQYTFDL